MTRARDVADTQDNVGGAVAPFVAGKNKVINGDFGIWQRGTSFNNNGGTYSADRFIVTGSGTAPTISQQTFTLGTAPVAGYEAQYYLRWDQSSAATAAQTFQQRIEDVRTFAGQTITISFWAKANSGSAAPDLKIGQSFGSGGSSGVTTNVQTGITFTSSWVRYSYSVSVPSILGKTIGANSYLQVYLQFPTSGTWQHDYWGFQVEAGSVATPFQTASGSIGGELALCQRYFETINTATSRLMSTGGYVQTTSVARFTVPVVQKRTTPTVTITGTLNVIYSTGSEAALSSISELDSNTSGNLLTFRYNTSGTPLTSGQACGLYASGGAVTFGISAEL